MNTRDARAVNVAGLIDNVLHELESVCRKRRVSVEFIGRAGGKPIRACREGLRRLFRLSLAHVIETATPPADVEILLRRVHASLLVCIRDQRGSATGESHGAATSSSDRSDETGFCCVDPEGKLAECRDIVAGHGGEMWGWKTVAGGTVICFDLPIRTTAAPEEIEAAPAAACSTFVDARADSCLTSN